MKAKILLFSLALCISYGTLWAQPTSFGGIIDSQAGNNAGTGGDNTNSYFGYQAGDSNTGIHNTFIGYRSGHNTTTPDGNTALGHSSLFSNLTGFWNTAIGTHALYSNITGIQNTASGFIALHHNTSGDHNTANGYFALFHNTTGSYNTAIGYNAGPINGGFSNTTALGHYAVPTASNQVRIGNANVLSIGGYAGWSNLSDGRFKKDIKEDIPGLDFITKLRPISYALDRAKLHSFLDKDSEKATSPENTTPQDYPREVGFVAQEVEQLLHENRYTRIGIETPQNEKDHYSIRYAEFVVPLVKAIQEQQQEIEVLKNLVNELISTNKANDLLKTAGEVKEGFILRQNTPNPFNQTTTINAVVPENIQQAKIVVYNLQGLELERYNIGKRGNVAVEIAGGRFPSGMYLYALIADDKVIDTKKMILTR